MAKEQRLQIRCTAEELKAWKNLAMSKEATLSNYVRTLLNRMVERANG